MDRRRSASANTLQEMDSIYLTHGDRYLPVGGDTCRSYSLPGIESRRPGLSPSIRYDRVRVIGCRQFWHGVDTWHREIHRATEQRVGLRCVRGGSADERVRRPSGCSGLWGGAAGGAMARRGAMGGEA